MDFDDLISVLWRTDLMSLKIDDLEIGGFWWDSDDLMSFMENYTAEFED